MLFNSMDFLVFFAVVISVYFATPGRFRAVFLLGASYFFYMCWNPKYALLIVASTVVDYFAGILMGRTQSPGRRRALLLLSLCTNLGLLFAFKYFNFAAESLNVILGFFKLPISATTLNVLLPVGISFYTFQTLSYTIDVYRSKMEPERNFLRFALYVSFFPQLVAGPIERATHLLPQLRLNHKFDAVRAWSGVQLMAWGLFKKVVIADRLAMYVDSVYNNAGDHTGPSYLLATYFFAYQIYCDFSGYSDIAIGSARVMGFDLMRNFDRPYFATTIVDFWRRWHISLSTWLRDYLYIPLGGSRGTVRRTYINLMLTMLLGGIWHGAAWTFVIWGALQGTMLCLSKLTLPARDRLAERIGMPGWLTHGIRVFVTFHLACLSWVFFRANSVEDAFHILARIGSGWPHLFVDAASLAYGIPGILALLFVQVLQGRKPIMERLDGAHIALRWAVYLACVFAIVLCGVDTDAAFIYFQF